VSGRGSPAATSSPATADSPSSPTTRHGSPPSHSEASPGDVDVSRVDQPAFGGYSWPGRRKTPSPAQAPTSGTAKRGKLSDCRKLEDAVSHEGRAVRRQRRASSREKQRAKAASGAAAGQGGEESETLFRCPWPSCHKVSGYWSALDILPQDLSTAACGAGHPTRTSNIGSLEHVLR
jgi:hypothetical protein